MQRLQPCMGMPRYLIPYPSAVYTTLRYVPAPYTPIQYIYSVYSFRYYACAVI